MDSALWQISFFALTLIILKPMLVIPSKGFQDILKITIGGYMNLSYITKLIIVVESYLYMFITIPGEQKPHWVPLHLASVACTLL